MGRIRKITLGLIVAAVAALCAVPVALADIPSSADHTAPSATYSGWGYVLSPATNTNVAAWKWSATGWQSATFPSGQSVWLAPWGSGWTWAWKTDSWYAIQTTSVATWKCNAVTGDKEVYSKRLRGTINIKKSNSSAALNVGTASIDNRLELVCGNGFLDAAAGGNTVYALVKSTSYSWCTGTWNTNCALNPIVATTVTGYIDVNDLTDWPLLPPDGNFGDLPE